MSEVYLLYINKSIHDALTTLSLVMVLMVVIVPTFHIFGDGHVVQMITIHSVYQEDVDKTFNDIFCQRQSHNMFIRYTFEYSRKRIFNVTPLSDIYEIYFA